MTPSEPPRGKRPRPASSGDKAGRATRGGKPQPPQRRGDTLPAAEWYSVRRAVNSKPSTYTCPFCRGHLLALTEHVLVAPEGDTTRRRHAHTKCTLEARAAGTLPSQEEWRATQPKPPGLLARLRARRDRS